MAVLSTGGRGRGNTVSEDPGLSEIPASSAPIRMGAGQVQMGAFRSPKKLISIFDPDEWEEFTNEWVRVLPSYYRVGRIAGAGDRGVDVAGWLTESGFRDEWDAYQCKHYAASLQPLDAHKEIFKFLWAVAEGVWVLPRAYYFIAPRGCGPHLLRLLNGADDLKAAFIEWLESQEDRSNVDRAHRLEAVRKLAQTIDFSIFREKNVDEMIELHKRTDRYVLRFGGGIPPVPEPGPVPQNPTDDEANFLRALWPVYVEKYGPEYAGFAECSAHPKAASHLLRQRELFYCAETLERHVRDLLPDGTYAGYTDQIHSGVVDTCEMEYGTGYERLAATLAQAATVDLSANALVQSGGVKEKQGACHQLAGDGRLRWVAEEI